MSVKRAFFSIFQKLTLFCCAIFFGFSNAFSANLPAGYTELEYIESTGTQWIDTGFTPNQDTRWTLDVLVPTAYAGAFSFGSATSGSFTPGFGVYGGNTSYLYGSIYGGEDFNPASGAFQAGTRYSLDLNKNIFTITTSSVIYTHTHSVQTFTAPATLKLFNLNVSNNRFGKFRMYLSKIWDNGSLVRDFVPAKNSSGVVGMYDTVSGTFFTNAGTGEFTAGPVVEIRIATTAYNSARFSPVQTDLNNAVATIRDIVTKTINQTAAIASLQADKQTRPEDACPAGKKCLLVETEENGVIVPHWYPIIEDVCGLPSGYTCLDYIESTGTQYIDTGVVFSSGSLKFEADVYTTINISAEEDFIGNFTGSSTSAGFVGGFANVTFLYSASPNVNVPRIKQNSWQKYIGEFTNSNQMILTYDGTTVSATRTKQHNSSPIVLFRGSESYKPAAHIRLGIVSIYLNNTKVRNLVPAKRNSDGAIGMYDLTNPNPATAFYTNKGSGTFTAGPEM